MKKTIMLLCCLATVVVAEPNPGESSAARWRIEAGPAYRSGVSMTFGAGNYSESAMIGNRVRAGFSGTPNQAGSLDPLDHHEYDDGYVRPDMGTEFHGDTWHWGYDNADQIQNGTLVFTASDGRDTELRRSGHDAPVGFENDDEAWGLQVQAEAMLMRRENTAFGMIVGYGRFKFGMDRQTSDFRDEQSWTVYDRFVQDRYDLGGVIPPPPPYAHGPEGPTPANPVPAPVISATPERSSFRTPVGGGSYTAWNEVQQALDIRIHVFSLGVSARYENEIFTASVSAGPTLNLVETDAAYVETLYGRSGTGPASVLRDWRAQSSETDVLAGAFIQAGAGLHKPAWHVGVSGFIRYDWTESLRGMVGPSSWSADFEGASAGIMLTLRFD